MSFNLFQPYLISFSILLYNKEAVLRTLYNLSASAPRVATTGAETALCSFEMVFLFHVVMFIIYISFFFFFSKLYGQKMIKEIFPLVIIFMLL